MAKEIKYPTFVNITKIIECGSKNCRYKLYIPFFNSADTKGDLIVILKNPSVANTRFTDVTVNKVCHVARNHNYCSVTIMNLFPYRATKSVNLIPFIRRSDFATIMQINNALLARACVGKDVVLAWGTNTISKSKSISLMYNLLTANTYTLTKSIAKNLFFVKNPKCKGSCNHCKILCHYKKYPFHAQRWSYASKLISY